MKYNSVSFIKKAVKAFMTEKGAKRIHTAKEYENMLNDVFEMLSDKMLEGYVLRPPFEFGEFCMGVFHGYTSSKLNEKMMFANDARRYFSDMYFVKYIPGENRCMLYYIFKSNDSMKEKITERIRNGKKIFAFENNK